LYLISEAFYAGRKAAEDILPDDLEMFMSLSLLVKKLSTDNCDVLGNFIDLLFHRIAAMESCSQKHWQQLEQLSKYCRNCVCTVCKAARKSNHSVQLSRQLDPIILPSLPRNSLEIRSKIRNGRRSFFNILPHPLIRKMVDPLDEHVYVLPSDCILHFLALGIKPLEFNKSVVKYPLTFLNETPRGIEIAKGLGKVRDGKLVSHRHFNLSFLEWKDDCESAKSNRMSKYPLWIFTITIFRDGDHRDSSDCTYPVAIGPKGKSHESVESIIKEDLIRLRTTAQRAVFGWSEEERPFPCTYSADLFMSLGDQPERRGGNVLQLGNSRNHARWRFACDYKQLLDVIPACPKCFDEMLHCDSLSTRGDSLVNKNSWIDRECHVCSKWMHDITHPLLSFRRTEYFPKDYKLGGEVGDGPLQPQELTYELLTKVINLSFEMVASGKWKMGRGMAYMTDNCINQKFAHIHLTRASNRCLLEKARGNQHYDTVRAEALVADHLKNPSRYLPLPIPILYTRGLPLHAFPDTPMHLISLGLGKAVFFRIMTWAARRGRKKIFVEIAKSLMEDLNSLKLPWLTLLPSTIKDKWGGWVSKNYSSLLQVALWIFAPIMSIDDLTEYMDPTEDPGKWTVKLIQGWLRARGLDSKVKGKTFWNEYSRSSKKGIQFRQYCRSSMRVPMK
jgi:hypothetical protein